VRVRNQRNVPEEIFPVPGRPEKGSEETGINGNGSQQNHEKL
jgi:hypothetical protein